MTTDLPNAPILSALPIASQLACLLRQHRALKADKQHVAARAVKEQALGLVEAFFDGQDDQWVSGAEDLEQVAAARAHVNATLTRWQFEQQEGAPF